MKTKGGGFFLSCWSLTNILSEFVAASLALNICIFEDTVSATFTWKNSNLLTVNVAQVEVSINQWGSVVEVLGHVI